MTNFLNDITPALISLLCTVLTALNGYLVTYINKQKQKLEQEIVNNIDKKYLNMIESTIIDCVKATNQTYVETLKKQDKFTVEAQKEAYDKTVNAVMTILNEDCLNYLETISNDISLYLKNKIEAEVNFEKE